jgi:hypothetical protein
MSRALGVLLVVAIAAPAFAQARRPPREPRSFLSVNGGVQNIASMTDSFSFEQYAEDGTIRAEYPGHASLLLDVTAGVRIWKRAGIGGGVTRASGPRDVAVHAEVPHPFFIDQHRTVEGTATDLSRDETAVHVQLYWEPRLTGRMRVRLFAGPSFIDVTQDVVEGGNVTESYPFDDAAYGSARVGRASASGFGGHAGADLSWMLNRRIGAGVLVRYSRAGLDLNAPGSRTVSSDAGGFQAGIGVRAVF